MSELAEASERGGASELGGAPGLERTLGSGEMDGFDSARPILSLRPERGPLPSFVRHLQR